MIYKRPGYLINGHLETTVPYLRYKTYQVPYERERLELEDGDFLDLDWIKNDNDKLIIICHGFEGNSRDYFVERTAKYFSQRSYNILMWHFRSCSKELNRLPHIYSFNDMADLHAVVNYATTTKKYSSIFLMGFSVGATTMLNYLSSKFLHEEIKATVAISVPLALPETLKKIKSGLHGLLYRRSFHDKLKRILIRKAKQYPKVWDLSVIEASYHMEDLIEIILASHKIENDYFEEISPIHQLHQIKTPTLIINSKNDPFLGPSSYPDPGIQQVKLCYPKSGGHVGFSLRGKDFSWIELRSENFFNGFL